MRVRRLEIAGFKSFADRTVIEFPQGMCAVVGPNGCGKSNLVDAVRWVLGEQSARQLRGQSMEDVLFNGAETRKPAGLAEVSLVLENDGSISSPQFADLSEIMITRRLYRSGDSEYLINRMPCRLKDIQQLLMDTGLGNRAYAIIEQGRVAAFIEARPEERRLWLEEAAGITRYKNQKKVSLRKMQAARDNLERLQDIIAEVETQMARLERQAKKAQRHQKLRRQIRELDLNILAFEYQRLSEQLQEVGAEAEAVGAQLLLAQQRLTGLETDLETMKVQLVSAENQIAQAGEKRLAAQGAIQKAENELTLLSRESENQRRLGSRYQAEREETKARLQALERQLAQARRRQQQGQAELEATRRRAQAAAEQVAQHQARVQRLEEAVDRAKTELVDHLARTSRLEARLDDLERAQAEAGRRRQQLEERSQALAAEIDQLQARHRQSRQSLEQLRTRREELARRLQELQDQRRRARERLQQLRQAEAQATRRRHGLQAQTEALAASLASHQWARPDVRRVLEAAAAGELPVAVRGVVAEHLQVTPGAEAVVEAALGPRLQAVVVTRGAEARALDTWLQEHHLGGVEVVALDELGPGAPPPEGGRPLSELARPEPETAALGHLLEGVAVCQDLAAAWRSAAGLAPGQALVTPAGRRLHRPGAARLGPAAPESSSVLAQRNQLAARRAELEAARQAEDQAARRRREAEAALAELEEQAQALEQNHRQMEGRLAGAEKETFRLEEEAKLKARQLEALEFDRQEIEAEAERCQQARRELEAELEQARQNRPRLEEALNRARQELERCRQELEEARRAESAARLAQAEAASQAEHAAAEAKRLAREVEAAHERLQALEAEIRAAAQSVESLAARRAQEQQRLGQLYQELDRLEEAHRQAREVLAQAQMRHADLEGALKQARAEQRELENQSQELALRRRELEIKREGLVEQCLERCRVDLTTHYADHLPSGSFDPETSRERLTKLRQRLARLGPVNLEAISEHQALAERHRFLSEQKADLEASLEDLRTAIRKINRTSRKRFLDTLEQVNARLAEVFPVLFGGGSARLELEQGADPLEAGLHLMVELPGKRLRNVTALSGGEKALSAAAVLFALFLIRPAPFCILDEVDAPLDEANVARFHQLLRELSRRSQILMVTHSRRTMEIMDLLYGVTMEEKGVSRLLSVDLAQGRELAA